MSRCRMWFVILLWTTTVLESKAMQELRDFLGSSTRIGPYRIVMPRIGSTDVRRSRRSASKMKPLLIGVENWMLDTILNEHLIVSPKFKVLSDDGSDFTAGNIGTCELRHGAVVGNEDSFVALTVCESSIVYGLIRVGEFFFYLQPLSDGRHVLWQPAATPVEKTEQSWKFGEHEATRSEDSKADDKNGTEGAESPKGDDLNIFDGNRVTSDAWRLRNVFRQEFEETIDESTNFYDKFATSHRRGRRDAASQHDDSARASRLRRAFMTYSANEFYNLTGDVIDVKTDSWNTRKSDGTDRVEELVADEDSERIGYFLDKNWERNKTPKKKSMMNEASNRWMEIAVAADYSVVEFHGPRVRQYIMALFNIVSAIYKDPSLESNLKLVIVRMVFYAEKKDGMVRKGNARRSLENVNRWNKKFLTASGENHDVAVWLTRQDLGGPSGYAPVSGVCDPARSCALNRDEGLTSAFIIAHEVAHVLGLTHDGDENAGNSCGSEAFMGSVMAPMVAATFHRFHWSSCSRREFHRSAKKWTCLLNQPDSEDATHLKATVQETFTMDEQCRMEFGDGYSLCRSIDLPEPCSHLWCGHNDSAQICKTKKGPPLEGTECGRDKWCVNGYCEFVDRRRFGLGPVVHNGRNGGWSSWSPWGKCSRSCGIGVQFRSRRCNGPSTSISGGVNCKGNVEELKVCRIVACSGQVDPRAQQCSRLVSRLPVSSPRRNHTWLAHEPEDERLKCKLICRNRQNPEEIYRSGENLVDGTPCSYGATNICVQGQCRTMGCDGVLNSTKVLDDCGECDGLNANCKKVRSRFQRKLRPGITRVAVIPEGASSARLELSLPNLPSVYANDVVITIRDRRRRRNDFPKLSSHARIIVVEGAAFYGKKTGDTYEISTKGSLFAEIVVAVGVPDEATRLGVLVGINLKYSTNRKDANATSRYSWLRGGWGPCSASCGGGTRQKTFACRDNTTGRIVPKRKCPLRMKPAQENEKCNTLSCEFKWIAAAWEQCNETCGSRGTKQRQIYCVHVSENVTKVEKENAAMAYRNMVPPDRCGPSPRTEEECNRVPCPGHRVLGDWSSCSRTCGRGVQSRLARCEPFDVAETPFSCEPFARIEHRSCKYQSAEYELCSNYACGIDSSEYCALSVLKRYCEIPEFKKRCCLSCRS